MNKKFKALVVIEENGKFIRKIIERKIDELPAGDVLIKVKYSSLNYKDALSAAGNKGVTRQYPHTPGIDAAGIVAAASSNKFKVGDEVLVTGYDLGMNTSGGFAEYIRVPTAWIVKLPKGLSLKESMTYGTAGFTAALALYKLEQCKEEKIDGEVLVTGATGGVGSLAVAILSKNNYQVITSTGKKDKTEFLKRIGAKNVIDRDEVDDKSGRALLNRRWKAAIDTVGGNILATVIKQMDYRCSVAACGNTYSPELHTTVFPFILRGVNLLGINSAETPMDLRLKIWHKLSSDWKPDCLNQIYTECSLEQLSDKIALILQGQIAGRVIVKL
jgi:putative YhdH/YhfP family quinone oxidoreductase